MNEMIDWGKMGGETRIKFVIPVGNPKKKWWQFWKRTGLSSKEAEESIKELLSVYREDVKFDEKNGEISSNKQSPYTKDMWFPSPQNDENVDITITLDENGKWVKK